MRLRNCSMQDQQVVMRRSNPCANKSLTLITFVNLIIKQMSSYLRLPPTIYLVSCFVKIRLFGRIVVMSFEVPCMQAHHAKDRKAGQGMKARIQVLRVQGKTRCTNQGEVCGLTAGKTKPASSVR